MVHYKDIRTYTLLLFLLTVGAPLQAAQLKESVTYQDKDTQLQEKDTALQQQREQNTTLQAKIAALQTQLQHKDIALKRKDATLQQQVRLLGNWLQVKDQKIAKLSQQLEQKKIKMRTI